MASITNVCRLFGVGVRNCSKNVFPDLSNNLSPIAKNFGNLQTRNYRQIRGVPRSLPWIPKKIEHQTEVQDPTVEEERLVTEVSQEINWQIAEDKTGRLFAVVQIAGKQFKITESDLVVVRGYWPPTPGDEITLEKVLIVGSKDFTLVGRPILNRQLVTIDATVIEKTLGPTTTHFTYRARKQVRRMRFYRFQQTMLRINEIRINGQVDQKLEVEGLDRVY